MYWATRFWITCHADHHDHGDEGGQRHEPQRQAVDAQRVEDVEALDPRRLLDELHAVGGVVEIGDQRDGRGEADDRADQRADADHRRIGVTAYSQDDQAEQNRKPDREAQVRR
jgi:hypothetical protein